MSSPRSLTVSIARGIADRIRATVILSSLKFAPLQKPHRARGLTSRLHHHHRSTDRNAIVEVDYVLVDKSDAAARRRRADSIRFVSSMQAEIGILAITVEIEGARPKRIFNSTGRPTGIRPIAGDSSHHVLGRSPGRPSLFAPDHGGAAEVACLCPADTYSIA